MREREAGREGLIVFDVKALAGSWGRLSGLGCVNQGWSVSD